MITARARAGAAAVNAGDPQTHRMVVVGGATGALVLSDGEQYDVTSDRWPALEACLSKPMWCRAVPISAGGSAVLAVQLRSRDRSSTISRCELLDVRANGSSWTRVAPAPLLRGSPAVAAVGENTVLLLGGSDEADCATSTVWLFDLCANAWRERPEWEMPCAAAQHCATLLSPPI